MKQLSSKMHLQKSLPEYYFSVHPLHPAYRLVTFVTTGEELLRLQKSQIVFVIVWQQVIFITRSLHLLNKEMEAPCLKEPSCLMITKNFLLERNYRILFLRRYGAMLLLLKATFHLRKEIFSSFAQENSFSGVATPTRRCVQRWTSANLSAEGLDCAWTV